MIPLDLQEIVFAVCLIVKDSIHLRLRLSLTNKGNLDPLEARLGPWLGNLALGVVWAFWHLPLFFIAGTSQSFMSFAGFVLLTTGYSWFCAWVREVSGKRTWAGLITHGWANAFVPLFPTLIMAAGVAQQRYWIWVGLTFVIGLIAMAIRSRKTKSTYLSRQPKLISF